MLPLELYYYFEMYVMETEIKVYFTICQRINILLLDVKSIIDFQLSRDKCGHICIMTELLPGVDLTPESD